MERAKNAGISCEVLIRKQYATMEEYDRALIDLLQKHQIDLIVLAGFMTIISDRVIDAYRNKIINVHPSLIPAFCGEGFYGLRVHEAALRRETDRCYHSLCKRGLRWRAHYFAKSGYGISRRYGADFAKTRYGRSRMEIVASGGFSVLPRQT